MVRPLIAVAFVLGVALTAEATPIQFIDTYTPTSALTLDGVGDSAAFSHDITPPVAATNDLDTYINGVLTPGEGYNSATDTLTSGVLTLSFTTCTGVPCTNGNFDLTLGGIDAGDYNFATTFSINQAQFNLVGQISNAGILTVSIVRTNAAGSLNFVGSVLNVSGTRQQEENENTEPTSVPEPATLLLAGAGLTALAHRRRNGPASSRRLS